MKRFFITSVMLLACALLFAVGLFLILALAPGTKILGIQYVASSIGKAEKTENFNEYINGDIVINTIDIPVNIVFESYTATKVKFIQYYSGWTTSLNRVPEVEIVRDSNGLKITTAEIERFVIGTNKEYGLTITLPTSWGTSGRHSIYVTSKNSKVNVTAHTTANINLVELNVHGGNAVNVNCKLTARDLNIYSSANLTISQEAIYVDNLTYETRNGDLIINYALTGNLDFTSRTGDLTFISCNNLKVKTGSGKINGKNNSGVIISGTANIETNSGSVNIYSLNNGSNNVISTKSGDITIGAINKGKVHSTHGNITISNIIDAEIIGGAGQINIGAVSMAAKISSIRGTVAVGNLKNGLTANNVTINTISGKIDAQNTRGTTKLYTKWADIYLNNGMSNDITIESGCGVNATGLKGNVKISGNRNMALNFASNITKVEIAGGKACRNIDASFENLTYNGVNYNLTTTQKNGGIAKIFNGNTCVKQGVSLNTETVNLANPTIKINATKCVINTYFKEI